MKNAKRGFFLFAFFILNFAFLTHLAAAAVVPPASRGRAFVVG
jgi:hypothetical protein